VHCSTPEPTTASGAKVFHLISARAETRDWLGQHGQREDGAFSFSGPISCATATPQGLEIYRDPRFSNPASGNFVVGDGRHGSVKAVLPVCAKARCHCSFTVSASVMSSPQSGFPPSPKALQALVDEVRKIPVYRLPRSPWSGSFQLRKAAQG